jgi:hypothetical protein
VEELEPLPLELLLVQLDPSDDDRALSWRTRERTDDARDGAAELAEEPERARRFGIADPQVSTRIHKYPQVSTSIGPKATSGRARVSTLFQCARAWLR